MREINASGSYLSSDLRLHFGLGNERMAPRVEIEWPSGERQILDNVPANQTVPLDEENASP